MRWLAPACALLVACIPAETYESIVELNKDFSSVNTDAALAADVKEILDRLHTFKVAVHPRIRIFYELLKRGITNHVHRTADTLYNIHKYNTYMGGQHDDDD